MADALGASASPADADADGMQARLAAGRIIAVQRIPARENRRRIAAGERAAALHPAARATAERAFDRPAEGLTDHPGVTR